MLRIKGEGLRGQAGLAFRPLDQPLAKGDRIYSMGNPHDVAFDVVECTYNGLVERSFDPSLPEFLADPDRLTQVFLNLARNALQS